MFIAVRCPLCLLTVYTISVNNGPNLNGFSVMSLAEEDLPFYNCPMPLCGYHVRTFHLVNLYVNPTITNLKHSISMGLNVTARTSDTRPFRSPSQVAALAISLDTVESEPATEEQPQPARKQAPQDIGHEDSQGGAAMPAPAVADTVRARPMTLILTDEPD